MLDIDISENTADKISQENRKATSNRTKEIQKRVPRLSVFFSQQMVIVALGFKKYLK